jgi:hypothetical protein
MALQVTHSQEIGRLDQEDIEKKMEVTVMSHVFHMRNKISMALSHI